MDRRLLSTVLALSTLLLAGCGDNPVTPDVSEDLHAELEYSGDHLMTLTDIEFEVRVHGSDAGTFTDLSYIAVEFRLEGETEWRATELSLHADHFSAEKMFFTSGEYEARVVGQLTGSTESLTLYQSVEHLHVERIHQEVGEFIVEFETFPGHVHEGDEVEATFWILEASTDGHAHGHPVEGLTPDIVCTDSDGATEEHVAHVHGAGEYGADHTAIEAGTASFEIHFSDTGGTDHHAEFAVPVSHAH